MVHKLTKRKHRSMPSCVWLHKSTQIEKKITTRMGHTTSLVVFILGLIRGADSSWRAREGTAGPGSAWRPWKLEAEWGKELQRLASGCCTARKIAGRAAGFRLPALLPGYVGAPPGHPQGRALPSNPQGFRASTSVAAAPTAPSLRGANEGGCRLVDASGADGEGDRRDLEIGRGEPGG